jgi:hypothetical protein
MNLNLIALRHRLRACGYSPIPCNGKRPPMEGWDEKINADDDEIRLWSGLYPHATNTGVFTRLVPTIDIDILNPEAAAAVENLVSERHAEHGNILVRFGLRPKRAIPFRTDEPFKKITANLVAPDGSEGQKIELLADGQQFIVAGIHPDTRKPYGWFGGELDETPRKDLPYIREADAGELVEAAVELLIRDFGYSRAQERPKERAKANGHDAGGVADWGYLSDAIRAGRDLHDSTRDYSAKLVASGMADGAAVNLTRSEMERCTAPHDQRWQERWDDIPRMVRDLPRRPSGPDSKIELNCESWWVDPEKIPPREFLYGKHYARGYVGASIGAGGRMKTSEGLFEAVEMACGFDLIDRKPLPTGPLRVADFNAEEEQDELDRRVAAICLRYNLTEKDLGGRLFVKSVRKRPLRFAALANGTPTLDQASLAALENFVTSKEIDVFMLDPWVSFHSLNESDNAHMDIVIKEGLGGIVERTRSAGEIFHHPGKPKPGQPDTVVEDARGASAIIWAVRSARVFNFMTPDAATKLGIAEDDRRRHIRVSNGKANMGPVGKAEWIKIEVENLPNGDEVAVSSPWKPADPFAGVSTADMHKCRELARTGEYRRDSRSPKWFGYVIAEVLKINVAHGAANDPKDLARVKQVLATWIKNKALKIDTRKDGGSREREFVVPGPWSDGDLADPDPEEITL